MSAACSPFHVLPEILIYLQNLRSTLRDRQTSATLSACMLLHKLLGGLHSVLCVAKHMEASSHVRLLGVLSHSHDRDRHSHLAHRKCACDTWRGQVSNAERVLTKRAGDNEVGGASGLQAASWYGTGLRLRIQAAVGGASFFHIVYRLCHGHASVLVLMNYPQVEALLVCCCRLLPMWATHLSGPAVQCHVRDMPCTACFYLCTTYILSND